MTQKFNKGDWVRIDPEHEARFHAGEEAIIIGSYFDQYGGKGADNHHQYTLHVKGHGRVSWYFEGELALIEPNRLDKLEQWELEEDALHKQQSDLDWIFTNGPELLKKPGVPGSTVAALGRCLGVNDLWGSRGEGYTYYANAYAILELATPFLREKDKAGFLEAAKLMVERLPVGKSE